LLRHWTLDTLRLCGRPRLQIGFDLRGTMMDHDDYNYAVFDMNRETPKFAEFQNHPLHAGGQAPDFPVEDLDTGQTVHLKDLWSNGLAIVEFGSYT
jgi:hypothetical protein